MLKIVGLLLFLTVSGLTVAEQEGAVHSRQKRQLFYICYEWRCGAYRDWTPCGTDCLTHRFRSCPPDAGFCSTSMTRRCCSTPATGCTGTCRECCDYRWQSVGICGSNCMIKQVRDCRKTGCRLERDRDCSGGNCVQVCSCQSWGGWSSCSSSCGTGQRTQMGYSCTGCERVDSVSRTESCLGTGTCNQCCVNWQSVGSCQGDCKTTQRRTCAKDGCNLDRRRECTGGLCPPCVCAVWTTLTSCNTECGTGTMTSIGVGCTTAACNNPIREESCVVNTCEQCDTTCSHWSSQWSICRNNCRQTRTRDCPEGSNCQETKTRECTGDNCECSCVWSEWSACTESCGSGTRTREGTFCAGCGVETMTQTETCLAGNCRVCCDPWSTPRCRSTCDRLQERECAPFFTGCKRSRTKSCTGGSCQCLCLTWTDPPCSNTCGTGTRTIVGSNCGGTCPTDPFLKEDNCEDNTCENCNNDCAPWQSWTVCNRNCMHSRERICPENSNCLSEKNNIACTDGKCDCSCKFGEWSACSSSDCNPQTRTRRCLDNDCRLETRTRACDANSC